ncbi:MAG: nucleotide sugar dehydrogenase, partial [Dehalococcoidia bacterium]
RGFKEGEDFDVVSNPEFLREGRGLYDFMYPNRIVIGSLSQRASQVMKDLYAPLVDGSALWDEAPPPADREIPVPIVDTDLASAQMIKYACNAFLATRVSFINEIASLCERVGAQVGEVARGMGYDPRIGHSYLEAGIGFGGPCLEKDLHALIKIADTTGYDPQLLRAVMTRNDRQVEEIVIKLKAAAGYLLYRKVVAVWGTAFKGGTNDVRNSQALKVIEHIEAEGAEVHAYDPAANDATLAIHPSIKTFDDPYEAVRHADALLVLTDWPEFKDLDMARVQQEMAVPVIVDGRNLLSPHAVTKIGIRYTGVGIS